MHILILTNGEYGNYQFCDLKASYDCIICADNGLSHARKLGIKPDLIMGDLDSAKDEDIAFFKQMNVPFRKFPSCKNETDTEIAIEYALEKGAHKITVYGGLGSRMDHSLGNIHLLRRACDRNVEMWLVNPQNKVTLIKDKIDLHESEGTLISLLPLSLVVEGVTTKGLAYETDQMTMELGTPIGMSNYFLGDKATITIKSGYLLVMLSRDDL